MIPASVQGSPGIRKPGLQTAFLVLLVLAAGIALWVGEFGWFSSFDLGLATGLAGAFFVTRLLTIRLPQGDDVYVTLVVGLCALAIADVPVALSASLGAGVVDSLARASHSTRHLTFQRALDTVRATAVLGMMAPWQLLLRPLSVEGQVDDRIVVAVLAAGICYAVVDVVTVAVQQRIAGGLPAFQGISTLLRPLGTMYLVHLAMAAVVVRLYAVGFAWSFPIALLMTLILQNSFNLYLRIRRGYVETIGALARAAELDRPHDEGHARRVADLAVAVGRRMGLASAELERIGYAALLHDIGRMGSARDNDAASRAQRGAEIVASIPFLQDVAPLIAWHETVEGSPDVPIGASIVRLCSHYDRLRSEAGAQGALEQLAREAGGIHGRVLETLDEVVRGRHARVGVGQ